MDIKYVIIVLSFLLKFDSFGQLDSSSVEHSDLVEWGLHGKVKSIQLLVYADATVKNGVPEPIDSLLWRVKTMVYYNREGNTDSIISYVKSDGGERVQSKMTYNYSGKEYIAYSNQERFSPKRMRRIWNDSYSYTIDIYESDSLVTKSVALLDKQFRVREIKESHFDAGKSAPFLELTRRYFFDRKGYLLKIEEEGDAGMEKTKVSHFEFDRYDNPIKSYRIINDGENNFLVLRLFEYYD